jgi:hypothetical protein
VVENQYGSNMNLMQMSVPDDVDLDELAKWMNVTELSESPSLVLVINDTKLLMSCV